MKKNFVVRLIAMLLCMVMVLAAAPVTFVPRAQAQEAAIVMDFIADASEASSEDWWEALRDGAAHAVYSNDDIRFAGYHGNADVNGTTAEERAAWDTAYASMRTWIDANTVWSINEDWLTNASSTDRCKKIMLNAGLDAKWGITFDIPASWKTWGNAYTTFILNVDAPVAGEYVMELSYLENLSGAKFDLYLNSEWDFRTPTGTPVVSGLQTRGSSDSVIDYTVGTVTLQEGSNQLAFIGCADTVGTRIQLADITFSLPTAEHTCADNNGDGLCDNCGAEVETAPTEQYGGRDLLFDFVDGRAEPLRNKSLTLADSDVIINYPECANSGANVVFSLQGLVQDTAVGEKMVLEIMADRAGWYWLQVRGGLFPTNGGEADVFVDSCYMGNITFCEGVAGHYSAKSNMNTIYLTEGQHKVTLTATQAGMLYLGKLSFYATEDPNEMELAAYPEKTDFLVDEKADLHVAFDGANGKTQTMKFVTAVPGYTNYYMAESSNTRVLRVSNGQAAAVSAGTCELTISGECQGKSFSKNVAVTVYAGTVAYGELTAEKRNVRQNQAPMQLQLTAYSAAGSAVAIPSGAAVIYESEDETIATVSQTGLVTFTGALGHTTITAKIVENGRTVTAACQLYVSNGKTEPTIYTYEERAIAQENAKTYSWAEQEKGNAVSAADFYVKNLETILDNFIREGTVPRATRVGYNYNAGNAYQYCRYCGCDLVSTYGAYPWIVDPIEHPWKIQCRKCLRYFPTNDFESYYKSGLDDSGYFHKELADEQYLVNELYPEMGESWGVDAGPGYDSGKIPTGGTISDVHTYLAYYMHSVFCTIGASKHSMETILDAMIKAYIYTGDEKYGNAGAILVDRLADIYPEYKRSNWSLQYANADGNGGAGKLVGCIWEANVIGPILAKAADAFWPCFENEEVVEYIRQYPEWKGVAAEEITTELLRENVDNGICRAIRKGFEEGDLSGNFGMQQAALCYAARALDSQPETQEMIELAFRYGTRTGTAGNYVQDGGAISQHIIDYIDRDGFGNEVSWLYNSLWLDRLLAIADALDGYETEGFDLWQNARFVNMFTSMSRLLLCGSTMAQVGEAGRIQMNGNGVSAAQLTTGFINTGNRDIARALYAANGNKVDGLHGDIFTKDPEDGLRGEIQSIVDEDGVWSRSESEMLAGYGISILRDGPALYTSSTRNQFSDYWMYFGKTVGGHGSRNALHIDMDAFGLNLSSHMGYPVSVDTNPERMQWVLNTSSHNTVVVNDRGQSELEYGGFPLHFDDAGKVKVMDADASNAYPETDIYRRTMVVVDNGDGTDLNYAIDFFRVLGGKEHVYSFHAAGDEAPTVEGLEMTAQSGGTYAGSNVPFGDWDYTGVGNATYNTGSGYSWLKNVSRDATPDTVFSIDFPVKDFRNQVSGSDGIHLKLHMLSEEPLTEVAIADAQPPQNGNNPSIIKYAMIRKSGEPDMDTLFTSVIEPYQDSSYIAATELVDTVLTDGEEHTEDRAAAIKVTLENGRVDYVVYASNPDCTYEIDGKFTFQGFVGVVSYMDQTVVYAYGNEAVKVANAIDNALPAVTGEVVSFTEGITLDHEMVVTVKEDVDVSELTGRYIYVNNDGFRNGAYRIYDAEDNGDTVTLSLKAQSLVRELVDVREIGKGYVYNISEGDSFTIPLSVESACTHRTGVSYVRNDDGTHTVVRTCIYCGEVTGTSVVACKDGTDADTNCDRCGAELALTIEKFNVTGVNMTLGNELELNIMLPKATIDAYGKDLTVTVIHHEYVDGDTAYTFNMADLPLYGGGKYYKASIRVAAAQMTDLVDVIVTDSDGNVYSNEFTTSVLTYVTNNLDKQTAKVKTLLVDMVNYGAAAQDNFSYRQDLYANSNLTESQKLLATGDVTCTDIRVKGTNYVGSNLSLQDCILLNFMFTGVADDVRETMYATVSFTGVLGNEVNVRVPVEKLMTRYAGVAVNQIVLADAVTPVTVTLYNADGSVYGYATDSVESYNARQNPNGTNALYTNIMKFAASALAYKQ